MKRRLKRILLIGSLAIAVFSLFFALVYQLLPSVRIQCVLAADRIGAPDRVVRYFGDDDRGVFTVAVETLIQGGSKSVPALIRGMDHADNRIRTMSAFTLGRIGDAANDAIPTLNAHLRSDPNEIVRSQCAKAIAHIRRDDPRLLVELTAWMAEGDVERRLRAIDALGQLNGPNAKAILERALQDENPAIVEAARDALGLDD